MRVKHPIAQVVIMVVAAMAVAVIANGFAGRTRRLALPGWYPNATTVPARPAATATAPAPVAPPVQTTIASPEQRATVVVPTATVAGTTVAPNPATATAEKAAAVQAPPKQAAPAVDLSRFTPHPDKAYVEIGGDDAAALHRAGVLFLDARRTSVFEDGHIAGARSYSVWESDVDEKVGALFEERGDPEEQNRPIVIYCSGGACEDSHMLAQKLWGIQFNNVYVYKDGYPDWVNRGLPVRKGATP